MQTEQVPKVRPWVRLWARFVDYFLLGYAVIWAAYLVDPYFSEEAPELYLLSTIFSVFFLEAALISFAGDTPGKWLLGVRVRDKEGGKLRLATSIARVFRVIIYGFGMNIGGLFVIPSFYHRLMERGITPWDKRLGVVVSHEKIGPARALVAGMVLAVLVYYNYV
ncbi:MAG: RDD family protein [Nitrospinota bacterium]|nr:RDD family protein [Nitrospinota bacterium]